MLPDGYPDDFPHDGLQDVWFRDVPWSVQSRVYNLDAKRKLRCIRNPATSVFVIVLKLNPEDPVQCHRFFSVAILRGWQPLVETKPGFPVEYVHQLCEGMEASSRWFEENYGNDKASIEAGIVRERQREEKDRVAAMRASTRMVTEGIRSFIENPAHGMKMGMSPRKRYEKFAAAATEFHNDAERKRHAALGRGEFSLVVPR